MVTERDAQRLLVLFGQIGKGRSMQFSAYHSVYPDMPSSLSQSTMFCTGLPGLSSVTELLDHSDREFIRQIPSMVSGQAAPSALNCGLYPHACRFEHVVKHVSNRDTRSEIDFLRICARP
jgi:hypothetical protein